MPGRKRWVFFRVPATGVWVRSMTSSLQVGEGKKELYCWWFRNPANSPVEVGNWSPIIYMVLVHPGWCGISEPSAVGWMELVNICWGLFLHLISAYVIRRKIWKNHICLDVFSFGKNKWDRSVHCCGGHWMILKWIDQGYIHLFFCWVFFQWKTKKPWISGQLVVPGWATVCPATHPPTHPPTHKLTIIVVVSLIGMSTTYVYCMGGTPVFLKNQQFAPAIKNGLRKHVRKNNPCIIHRKTWPFSCW